MDENREKGYSPRENARAQSLAMFACVCSAFLTMALGAPLMFSRASKAKIYLGYAIPQLCNAAAYFIAVREKRELFWPIVDKARVRAEDYFFVALVAIGLVVAGIPIARLCQAIYDAIGLSPSVVLPSLDGFGDYALVFVLICALPAVGEELLYRKTLCDGLSGASDHAAILVSAAIFALMHLNPAQLAYQFVMGCVLAIVYVGAKNVTLTMLAHCLNNFIVIFALSRIPGIGALGAGANVGLFALGAAIVAVGVCAILRKARLDRARRGGVAPGVFVLIALYCVVWAGFAILGGNRR